MKIIQTPVRFFPAIGGVEKYVYCLSYQLVKHGHEITVICANEPQSDLKNVQGIIVKRLPYYFKVANTNITMNLFSQLMLEDFDVIHTHIPTPWSSELSVICSRIKKKPCVITYHNDVEKTGFLGVITRIYNLTILKWVLSTADVIIVTQPRYIKDSKYLSKFTNKIKIIPNGILELPQLSMKTRQQRTILFVSVLDEFHRYKGLEFLLLAVRSLVSIWPDLSLEVVGSGKLVDEYQKLTKELHIEHYVNFHGYVDDQKLIELYQSSTVFILPSIDSHEGFGIVLLEAMSNQIPVITTDVVGLSADIIKYETGLIISAKDPIAIVEAINVIFSSPQNTKIMGENGRYLVSKKYLWGTISKQVEDIYKEIIR